MIRLLLALFFVVAIPTVARFLFLGIDTSIDGFMDISPILRGIAFLLLIISGTALGVFGSLTIPRLLGKPDISWSEALRDRHAVIGSSILAPLIVSGFYPDIAKIESETIVFLLCFQNGYFWENVTSLIYRRA